MKETIHTTPIAFGKTMMNRILHVLLETEVGTTILVPRYGYQTLKVSMYQNG